MLDKPKIEEIEEEMNQEKKEMLPRLDDESETESEDEVEIEIANPRSFSQCDVWLKFMRENKHRAPSLCKVLNLLITIPITNASIERFFKVLKTIKSKIRNRITKKRLAKIMFIRFFCIFEKCDWDELIQIYEAL